MPTSIAGKLRIKEGFSLKTLHAPKSFMKHLGPLPKGVSVDVSGGSCDQVHWFVTTRKQMENELIKVLNLLGPATVCWIYFPKASSGIQTDLTRDKGWEALLKHKDLQWLSLISFDETWSAFGMRRKKEAELAKQAKPSEREIFKYIDPQKKQVTLPPDLAAALKKLPDQEAFFNTLSYSNRKEYVEWVVSAKREETRKARVNGCVERLAKGWKNPSNR
jgi:hypothetical protein